MPDQTDFSFLQPESATKGRSQNYANPTQVNQSTKSFGKDAEQFMIEPFAKPFPMEQQKAESGEFTQQFSNWLGQQETPEATRQRFENRYNYQPTREAYIRGQEAMEDVMSAIRATPDRVQASSRESMLNQSQLQNIVNKDVQGLMETYNQLGTVTEQQGRRLAMIEQNLNDAGKLEMAQQQKMMTPWLQAYQDKNIAQAREFSGWTFANQLELDRLLSNQQAGYNWTNAEAQRAHELSMQENAFQNNLEMMEKQSEYALEFWG